MPFFVENSSSNGNDGNVDDGAALKAKAAQVKGDMTISDTFQQGIFFKLVPGNFVQTFTATTISSPNYLGVIVLAIVLACANARLQRTHQQQHRTSSSSPDHRLATADIFLLFLTQLNKLLIILLEWWIVLTPIAVLSLIAGALGSRDDLTEGMSNVALLIATACCAWLSHVFLVYMVMYVVCVRENPWHYVRFIFPALAVAVATSSSAATLPVTMRCVAKSRMVPTTIRNLSCPSGRRSIWMEARSISPPSSRIWPSVMASRTTWVSCSSF
eukprot:GEMP01039309.1.p1 GENE.GEMP01039309.1~~GEMP01039309.1.p1  ORF type:complete len:272 (+),score=81.99 GEMP01039309.1:700-1515(+)